MGIVMFLSSLLNFIPRCNKDQTAEFVWPLFGYMISIMFPYLIAGYNFFICAIKFFKNANFRPECLVSKSFLVVNFIILSPMACLLALLIALAILASPIALYAQIKERYFPPQSEEEIEDSQADIEIPPNEALE